MSTFKIKKKGEPRRGGVKPSGPPVDNLLAGGEDDRVEHDEAGDGAEELVGRVGQQLLLLALQCRRGRHLGVQGPVTSLTYSFIFF